MPIVSPNNNEIRLNLRIPMDSSRIADKPEADCSMPNSEADKRCRPPLPRATTPNVNSSSPYFGAGFCRTDVNLIGTSEIMDSSVDMEEIANAFRKGCRTDESVINGYSLLEKLGEGTFGKVKKAVQIETGKEVAIKIIDTQRLRRLRRGVVNVEREIFVQRQIKDDRVVQIIDVFRDEVNGKIHIVMDLLTGCSLQTLLDKNQVFSEEEAKKYFEQILAGLESIHNAGVVHRDMKPGNMILTNDEKVKIIDFGSAEKLLRSKHLPYGSIKNNFKGTPSFIPPEHFTGPDCINGFKVDIWSIGVTLFYWVTGKLPFKGKNLYDLYNKIEKGRYIVPLVLSAEIRDLLKHLLDPNPDKRYGIEEIKKHPWFKNDQNSICDTLNNKTSQLVRQQSKQNCVGRRYQKILNSI